MAQFNDWSKSYQESLGNVKMAAIRIAEKFNIPEEDWPHELKNEKIQFSHKDIPDELKNPSGIYWPKSQEEFEQLTKSKAPQPNTKDEPQVYKHVKDVPPLKPKSAPTQNFKERFNNEKFDIAQCQTCGNYGAKKGLNSNGECPNCA